MRPSHVTEGDNPQRVDAAALAHVVVKFHDEEGVADRIDGRSWDRLLDRFPDLSIEPLFSMSTEELAGLTGSARARDRTYRPPDFSAFRRVSGPLDTDLVELAAALERWSIVQEAYAVGPPPPLPVLVDPSNDVHWPDQGYLDAAPDGIDAEYVWPRAGGKGLTGGAGEGVTIVDLERGWFLTHEDLQAKAIVVQSGINTTEKDHGTMALGTVVGVDNDKGVVGIAAHATARVVSAQRTSSTFSRADAILNVLPTMAFGDVLLLEEQAQDASTKALLPLEWHLAEYEAIRLATALGIVVVEPAGNGGANLDTLATSSGKHIFDRTSSTDFRDSGAIMVAAAKPFVPHKPYLDPNGSTNTGNRVDCYGWGQSIKTTSYDDKTGTPGYGLFGGTSGASAMIAGAAAVVQAMCEQNQGFRMSPGQMRSVLSDPTFGTSPAQPMLGSYGLGIMPDLKSIATNALGLIPDVYLRDFLGDTGDPHQGAINASPDVILLPAKVADPQTSFGAGSGVEDLNTLGHEATANQDNYLYVRVRNRGTPTVTNAEATVYWSPVATLVAPYLWTKIGTAKIPTIPTGDVLTVSPSITWKAADVPGPGHYCFVAMVSHPDDPAPLPAQFFAWDEFRRFIRVNNNVTWRNFNVVKNTAPAPSPASPPPQPGLEGELALPFLVAGAPEIGTQFRLVISPRLPRGARLWLEVTDDVFDQWSPLPGAEWIEGGHALIPLKSHMPTQLGPVWLAAATTKAMRLVVRMPEETRAPHEIAAAQWYEEEEVGRVTWRIESARAER